jgi:hypothetical protein
MRAIIVGLVLSLALVAGPNAQAQTIVGGVFDRCVTVVGHVFVDDVTAGRYAQDDAMLRNVRIYADGGSSVLTDRNGKYSFPCLNPGVHVLRLDTNTLPPGTRAYGVHDNDDPRSTTRLVRGLFDGGMIDTINFAIDGHPSTSPT